jgi:uncharacterized protein DUF1549/uncharacterized protein DUF1553
MTSAEIDVALKAAWQSAGVTATPAATDAVWLRRAWLDLVGTIPPPEEVRRFLGDTSADKRQRAVDELLSSPLWAEHWTTYWENVWLGRDVRGQEVDRQAFRGWLYAQFASNAPWNRIATELLSATGSNKENGAVNWTIKYQQTPEDMAGAASRTLLGVQIQCAQCHDHKTEKWKQQDFQRFAAAFVRTRIAPADADKVPPATSGDAGMASPPPKPPTRPIRTFEVRDLDRPAPRFSKMADFAAIARAKPTALDGTDLGEGEGVRGALAHWVTSEQNPWFGHAFVNRMWAHFLGRGFVDPVDDLRPSNPPALPALFDALAQDFATSGYDIKHLVRIIVGSAAYARSAAAVDAATAKNDPEMKLWERFRITPLGPDELLNALVAATDLDGIVRATGRLDLEQVRARVRQRYGFLFDVDEESDQADYDGTIAQALALVNGTVIATGASVLPGSALADVLASPVEDPARIEALYVRSLSRPPTSNEIEEWTNFVAASSSLPVAPPALPSDAGAKSRDKKLLPPQPDPLRGLDNRAGSQRTNARVRAWEDMFWALLNSSEFVLNH